MKMDMQNLEAFVNQLILLKRLDSCEEEYLRESAQEGAEQLLEAMCRVYGVYKNDMIIRTAETCRERMELVRRLAESEGEQYTENDRDYVRKTIEECSRARSCAVKLEKSGRKRIV